MVRVVIGKSVQFVPERVARILALVVDQAERIDKPKKVKIAIACAGTDIRAEVTELISAPLIPV